MNQRLDPDRIIEVSAGELDEWAWLCAHVEHWLEHADPDVMDDYSRYSYPSPRFDDVVSTLGGFAVRMRRLARGDRGQP